MFTLRCFQWHLISIKWNAITQHWEHLVLTDLHNGVLVTSVWAAVSGRSGLEQIQETTDRLWPASSGYTLRSGTARTATGWHLFLSLNSVIMSGRSPGLSSSLTRQPSSPAPTPFCMINSHTTPLHFGTAGEPLAVFDLVTIVLKNVDTSLKFVWLFMRVLLWKC